MSQAGPAAEGVRAPLRRVVVLIPTYNERDNLPGVVQRVRRIADQVDVCVLDDGSPDGTGEIADALAAADPAVHVLHRARKEGLGAAYLEGFRWAIERGYDAIVEMDADGSHRPDDLPALLTAADDADVVIGSRWVPGGRVVNWPPHRRALSIGANVYVRVLLGMAVRDATAGFRVYRTTALETMGLADVASQGYCFQVDLTWRASRAALRIIEVPIEFVEREIGTSKMSGDVVLESLTRVAGWSIEYRLGRLRETGAGALARLRARR